MIKFSKVSKRYLHNKVFVDLDIEINPKDLVIIMGKSGSGKSTFIKMLIGMEQPNEGSITVDDIEISKLNFNDTQLYRKRIGIIFQDYKLLKDKNVYENVAFSMEVSGNTNEEIKKTVPKVLDQVGLLNKQQNFPNELSGGEQQRIAIARALVHNPNLIIADEPTGNLDIDNAKIILDILKTINSKGKTLIITTHNQFILEYLSNYKLFEIVDKKMLQRKRKVVLDNM